MRFASILSCLAALLQLASPAAIKETRASTPAEDPFYVPPNDFASAKPGTVLNDRRITAAIFGVFPVPVDSRQLLYRTTAIDGSPIATVTTIFKPAFASRDRIVSFSTAYDSSATKCNPSYTYRWGARQTDPVSAAEFLIIQAYLLSGYTVISSDYEGPEAAFSPGRLSGMGVLDSMRAFTAYAPQMDLSPNPVFVGVGYSGGAIANGWAASLHAKYAPELNVKGWAIGGTPANLTSTLLFVDGTVFSGFLPGAVAGLAKPTAYGARINPVLDKIITPEGRKILKTGNEECVDVNLIKFANRSMLDPKIQSLGSNLLYQPDIAAVLKDTTMGLVKDEMPKAPVFIYHAQDDEIIPFSSAQLLRKQWCDQGVSARFTNYAAGGHITTEVVALPETIKFTKDAFDGKVGGACTSDTVLENKLNPLALGLTLEPILALLANELLKLGPKDVAWAENIIAAQGK